MKLIKKNKSEIKFIVQILVLTTVALVMAYFMS